MLRRHPLLQCTIALLTSLALVVSISACDSLGELGGDEDDPDVGLGSFELTLSGAIDTTLTGHAVFGTTTVERADTDEEQEMFGLAFMPDTSETEVNHTTWFAAQIMRASTRPESGEYAFVNVAENHINQNDLPTEDFVFGFQTEDTTRTVIVASDSGTLTLTTSSSSRVAGTFSVEASGMHYEPGEMEEPQEGTLTVEGEFNAIGGKLPSEN